MECKQNSLVPKRPPPHVSSHAQPRGLRLRTLRPMVCLLVKSSPICPCFWQPHMAHPLSH